LENPIHAVTSYFFFLFSPPPKEDPCSERLPIVSFSVKFKDGKPVVTVTTPDGMKDSRKGALATIVGAIDFDINEFVELSKTERGRKQQVEIFKSFLDEEVKEELRRYEANTKANYDERTEINRMIKDKEAAIKQSPLYNRIGIDKFVPVNVDSVYADLKAAQEKNNKIIAAQGEARNIEESIVREEREIKELTEKLDELKFNVSASKERFTKATKWLSENIIVDASDFEETIRNANTKNNECAEAAKVQKDIDLVARMKEEAGELTVKIEAGKQEIENTIKDMSSPVEGLMFDSEQLIYNGVPVHPSSLSTSEIEELGIRLKIAENPEFGILFIGRAESIGAKRFETIRKLAKKLNLQIIGEEVRRGQQKLTIEIIGE